jgi:transcriptional regulator with XRE-family HTH domain
MIRDRTEGVTMPMDARHVGAGPAIGVRIAEARRAAGVTQAAFASQFGVSVRMLQYWESGEVVPYRYLDRLAEALGCSSEWLLFGKQRAPAPEALRTSRDRLQDQAGRLAANIERFDELRKTTHELTRSASERYGARTARRTRPAE